MSNIIGLAMESLHRPLLVHSLDLHHNLCLQTGGVSAPMLFHCLCLQTVYAHVDGALATWVWCRLWGACQVYVRWQVVDTSQEKNDVETAKKSKPEWLFFMCTYTQYVNFILNFCMPVYFHVHKCLNGKYFVFIVCRAKHQTCYLILARGMFL